MQAKSQPGGKWQRICYNGKTVDFCLICLIIPKIHGCMAVFFGTVYIVFYTKQW